MLQHHSRLDSRSARFPGAGASAAAAGLHEVRKLYEKESRRADALQAEASALRRSSSQQQAELERLVREAGFLKQARDAAVGSLEENSAYVKKLELKLTGGKGQYLVEQNTKLRSALAEAHGQHAVSAGRGAAAAEREGGQSGG